MSPNWSGSSCRRCSAPAAEARRAPSSMFDYRYHALSLAAVLFALALGVLIGVAIGDSNLVSSAKSGVVHNLNSEIGEARHQVGQLQAKLSEEEAFASGLYPLAVHELLNGR